MRCLFCKLDSSSSRSVEHILPESLGNHSHVLPRGVVCDQCNNYFATKIEKPFLESDAITRLRFEQAIPSKRGRIPPLSGILAPGVPAILRRSAGDPWLSIEVPPEDVRHLSHALSGTLIVPAEGKPPNAIIVSRFLAKVALEVLARRVVLHADGLAYLIDEPQLDPLRTHARYGQPQSWPVSVRRIYPSDACWVEAGDTTVQLVHEFDILHTPSSEYYFILALFGLELVINYGGPEIGEYDRWIAEHAGQSPLYTGKNSSSDLRPMPWPSIRSP